MLVLLFVKYISDKYAGQKDALIDVPAGGGFVDMVALKGDKEIGGKINKIIGKLAEANDLKGVIDVADFNDAEKLGKGKEMDPTCGSASLLLKAYDEARSNTGLDITIYGQEMDNATAALAKMNMILRDCPTAEIWKDNTLSSPHFKQAGGYLKAFNFVVANPPFSTKAWSDGFNPSKDEFYRFDMAFRPTRTATMRSCCTS